MSDNKIHTLGRIDQAIRGINNDGTDDGYIPPQSENGALERIEKSIKDIDINGIKNSYKVLQTGEGHAEDYPMLISPNYQFKPSIRDKVFFEDSITYNPAAQGMKIASHNDGPGEHVKMCAPFASIHEDNPQPAFIELGSDTVKATLKKDDLVLTGEGNTWDGEHGSLKEAFARAGISAIQQPASYYFNNYRDQSSSPDIFMVYGKIEENVRKNESVSAASNNIYTDPANSELEGYESWRAFHDDDSNGWCTDNSSASLIYKFNVVTILQSMSFRIKWDGALLADHSCEGLRLYYKNSDNEWVGNIRIADYTIPSGSPAGYKDFEVTFNSPICPKGEVKISLGFNMVPESEVDVKFSIQNVIFNGYESRVQTDSKAYGCSIWYKGACYGNAGLDYTELKGTLVTGETTVTITDSSINDTCTYDIYTSVYGINPTDVTISGNTMTLTFAAQQSDLGVKVRVS